MPVTVIATVGGSTSNSYATVAAADAYALNVVGPSASAWAAKTADQKAQALITATLAIDALPFIGSLATVTQSLEWPRFNARTSTGRLFSSDTLPTRLVNATIITALDYSVDATSDVLSPLANDKKRVQAGDVEVEYFAPTVNDYDAMLIGFPSFVKALLAPLLRSLSLADYWGVGTALRGS